MNRTRLFLAVQSILYILAAALLIAAVIGVYTAGVAARAEDPSARIFTREIAAERLASVAPLIAAALVTTAVGLILGVKDAGGLKPAKGGRVENRAPGGKAVRAALLIAAAALIVAGVLNGGARAVFVKAVKICTECVGLG